MKRKIVMILVTFVLAMTLAVTANAANVKEDTSTYAGNGDVYIIGSSKFSSNIVVTGKMIGVAGAREAVIQYMIYNNYDFDPEDLQVYYYNDLTKTWKVLPETSEDEIRNLTEEETQALTQNLNIYYENQEEKKIEVPYDVNEKEGYNLNIYSYDLQGNKVKVEYKDGKLLIPATSSYVQIEFVNEQDENDVIHLETINKNSETSNFETDVVAVNNLADLKEAIANNKRYIRLNSDITDITETITIPYNVSFNGAGYKLAFKNIQKTSTSEVASGLVISKNEVVGTSVIRDLTIEMDGKEGWQGNYGLQIYGTNATISNYKGTRCDAALLINGSFVDINGKIDVTGNEFGGIEVSKGSSPDLSNSTLQWDISEAIMEDESAIKPIIWLENGQGTVPKRSNLVENTTIPTELGKTQTFYYTNKSVFENMEVSTYEELKFAMKSEDVKNVKLLENIDLLTGIVVAKTKVLDLNGKTLTAKNDTEGIGIFNIIGNGDLTINGDGTIDSACQTNDYSMAVWVTEYGKLTINGGTYTNLGAKDFEDDNTTSNNNELIEVRDYAQVTINGGRFIGNTKNATHGAKYTLNLKDAHKTTAKITVKGGTFTSYNPAVSKSENPIMNFVADGYKVVADGDNYTVKAAETTDTAVVNGVTYTTLTDAVAAAESGETVKLIKDITLDEVLVVNKTVTLDLNGHTINNEVDLWNKATKAWSLISVRKGGELTVTGNGTLKAKENDCYAIDLQEGGIATIENGTFIGNLTAVYVKEGTATINGGNYSIQQYYPTNPYEYILNCTDDNYKTGTAKIVVKGGTFAKFNPAANRAEGKWTDFLADNHKVIVNGDNYTVTAAEENDAVLVNGVAYPSIVDALAAAGDDDVLIKFLQDQTL